MTDSVFLNGFQNPRISTYRWPVFLAILLHLLFFGLLLSHYSLDQATAYTQKTAVQANLVSNAELSAMLAKATPKPAPIQQHTVPKIVPPQSIKAPTPPPLPVKTTPGPIIPTKVAPPKTAPKPIKQKSMEESLLQAELNKTEIPSTKMTEERLMAEQLQSETKTAQTSTQSSSKPSQATLGEINQYKALILQQIQQNWIMPAKITDLSCVLQIQLAPGGVVLDVHLLKSSGNSALDRSAIAAVNKASPLPTPKDSAAFSAFRSFTLTVKPE